MTTRKPIRRTIPDVRTAPPRPLARRADEHIGYPTAAELVSSSTEWRRWLDEALRSVLRPAALAGAVGLAASASAGCTNVADDATRRVVALLDEGGAPETPDASQADAAGPEGGGIVMYPVPGSAGAGGGSQAGTGGPVAHPLPVQPPQPPSSGGSGDVVVDHPPAPPATDGVPDPGIASVRPKPPVLPQADPPQVRGRIRIVRPHPRPPALPGGL